MPYYGGTPMAADPSFLMERLMRNGMTRVQAAAVLGNLQRESGLASNNMNKDEGAYGLMQWRGDRFTNLQQFAEKQGVPWTDPGAQADFIGHEMGGTERKNAQGFLKAKTVDEASAALRPIIRYGDDSGAERAMFANQFFGADDAAPQATAAPSNDPQSASAQPAISRETPEQRYYRMAYADRAGQGTTQRGLRGGLASIGEAIGAYAEKPGRAQANVARLGNALGFGGQPAAGAPVAQAPPGALPDRGALAAQVAGPPPAGVSEMPPGAPEPPRFPGGIPQPRPRPLTGPSLPPDDRLLGAGPTVAEMGAQPEMGSLVDPMGWDYA
jgi:hypothetical protein